MTPHPLSTKRLRVDLFCRVVDNFGDAGVCWRLARQLTDEFGCSVTLVIDELALFAMIEPQVDLNASEQTVRGVDIRQWQTFQNSCDAALVIEAFACDPPDAYVQSMAARTQKPLWINLEYLSAEDWVDGVHGLPSPHPKLPLTKYFFVPGFSEKSGGLLRERSVQPLYTIDATTGITIQDSSPPPIHAFVHAPLRVFSFAYPHAPLRALAEGFAAANRSIDLSLAAANSETQPHWKKLDAVPQSDFDALLSRFDLLIVRGEDSFVRAQLAGKPMLWHIYPTPDRAHIVKLNAWLDQYLLGLADDAKRVYRRAAHALVDPTLHEDDVAAFSDFARQMHVFAAHSIQWQRQICTMPDLASQLIEFAQTTGMRFN